MVGYRTLPRAESGVLLGLSQGNSSFVSRNELFAGLVLLGFANGISGQVISSVAQFGIAAALLSTFNISVIVWSACAISIWFLLRGPVQPVRTFDWVMTTCVLVALLMPVAQLSWLALTGLAIHIMRSSPRSSFLHRGACILLAMTVPMFWGRLLFAVLSDLILQGDATLVGWLVGTPRVGNAIQFADGSGYLWIAPACSSLANISLAILCWVTIAKALNHPGSWWDVGWVVVACAAVVAINVTRISLIGLHPEQYDLIHGPVGLAVASWTILGVTLGICLLGVRRDLPARA
jgi:exosortase/archaeosortase family protein